MSKLGKLLGTVASSYHSGAGDPYWANVVFLMGWDGSNGSTPTPDESPSAAAITYTGTAAVSTAQSKYGGSSLRVASGGNYCSIPQIDITGDFTMECFARFDNTGIWSCLFGDFDNTTNSWGFLRTNANGLIFVVKNTVMDSLSIPSSSIVANTWYHFAVSRNGDTTKLYKDGVVKSTKTGTTGIAIGLEDRAIRFGADYVGGLDPMTGYLDEVRITDGVGRYPSDFTPPAAKFPRF